MPTIKAVNWKRGRSGKRRKGINTCWRKEKKRNTAVTPALEHPALGKSEKKRTTETP